jgi:hypothetical protein
MTKPIEKWANFVWPEDEEWRPVEGFHGYEVSRNGRLRSARKGVNKRLVKGEFDKDGYIRVAMWRDGRPHKMHLHRLVALTFVGGRTAERDFACHRNGRRTENHAGNLKWATQAENCADKIEHGTHQIGSKHGSATIDEPTASEVKRLLSAPKYKGQITDIAAELGISKHIVFDIKRGRIWRHV